MAHYNSFTYQQVILANLFPPLTLLASFVHWLVTASVIAVAGTFILTFNSAESDSRNKGRGVSLIFGLALIVPGAVALTKSLGLPNGQISAGLGLLCATLLFFPSALNLWNFLPEVSWRFQGRARSQEKDFHLFISLQILNLIFVGAATEMQADLLLPVFLTSTLVSMMAYSVLTFLYRVSERTLNSLILEWLVFALAIVGVLYLFLTAMVFPALAFTGTIQKVFSLLVAMGLAVWLMDCSLVLMNLRMNNLKLDEVGGLHLILLPLSPTPWRWWKIFVNIPASMLAYYFLNQQFFQFDWNFLGQKTVFLMGLILLFSNWIWILPVKSPSWFHVTHPYVYGVAALIGFSVFQDKIMATDSGNSVALKMLFSTFNAAKPVLNQEFYRHLQNSTNIPKSIVLPPKEINLTKGPVGNSGTAGSSVLPVPPNIIIIVVDSLRADYLTPYNSQSKITPSIATFADEAIRFENAFSRYGATGLSEPSIWVGGMLVHQQYITPFYSMNSLQKLLEAENYQIAISRDSILKQIVKPSEKIQELDPNVDTQNLDLCETLPRLHQQFKSHQFSSNVEKPSPFFAYTQPQNIHISVLNRTSVPVTNKEFEGFHSGYARALHRIDRCFGEFITKLKDDNLYNNTIVILTADHGDSLGEEGRFGHAYTIFPEIMRIPLLIHLPSEMQNQWQWDTKGLAFSTDITPSLYTLLGHELNDNPWLFGQSLFWPKNSLNPRKNQEPYLLASSYGAVYGLLNQSGTEMYIVDAINFKDYLYDLRANPPALRTVNTEMRVVKSKQISDRLNELNLFYNYKGTHEEL